MLTGPKRKNALISFAPGNLGHQRESKGGPAGGGGRGTDDDCTLGCGGLYCGMEAACWDGDGGGDDTFCLMSSSRACSVAMFRGYLFLLGSELFYAAPHDIEIGRQGLKLLHRVRGSCSHGRLRRRDG